MIVMKSFVFCVIMTCSPLKVICFGGMSSQKSLLMPFMLISCLAYSLPLKMEGDMFL
jgi:hypothetical protein